MEQNGVGSYRHRRSPSSDRFLGVFSPPFSDASISTSPSAVAGDELNEDDVFYTTDFSVPRRSNPTSPVFSQRSSFRRQEKFGILAALPGDDRRNPDVVVQKPASISSSPTATSFSRDIPSIPKPHHLSMEIKYSQSMPMRRFQQSAPMNVPIMPRKQPRNGEQLAGVDMGDEDEEILPPHEIVARGSFKNQNTTFSVLEGAGRTLKGRDLRQVRNAVLRQTGFLD